MTLSNVVIKALECCIVARSYNSFFKVFHIVFINANSGPFKTRVFLKEPNLTVVQNTAHLTAIWQE